MITYSLKHRQDHLHLHVFCLNDYFFNLVLFPSMFTLTIELLFDVDGDFWAGQAVARVWKGENPGQESAKAWGKPWAQECTRGHLKTLEMTNFPTTHLLTSLALSQSRKGLNSNSAQQPVIASHLDSQASCGHISLDKHISKWIQGMLENIIQIELWYNMCCIST